MSGSVRGSGAIPRAYSHRANAERNFQMAAPGPPPKRFSKKCLGKGWRGEGSLAVLRRRAKPYGDWPASAPCQRPLDAATISEIYFGICSRQRAHNEA